MRIRRISASDIPILKELARKSGFPYPEFDDPHIEAVLVVADAEDRPIMACLAKRLIELYLFVDPDRPATVKMSAIGLLHQGMANQLRALGYNSVECFPPSQIAAKFGRRLERTWNWAKNWPSWTIRF